MNWIANRIIINEEFWKKQFQSFHNQTNKPIGTKTIIIFVAATAHTKDFEYFLDIGMTQFIQWSGKIMFLLYSLRYTRDKFIF